LSECPQASSPSDQLIRQTRQHPPPTTYKAHVRWPATEPPTTHSLRLLPDRIRWNWPQNPLCRDGCAFYLVRDQAARRSWHLDHATETTSCQWSRGPDGKGMSRWFIR